MTATHSRTPAERDPPGAGPQLAPEAARQGRTTGHIRWVLAISVVLTVTA